MVRRIFTPTLYFRFCCFVLFSVAASASFNGFYQQMHFREKGMPGYNAPAPFEKTVDGTASRPYIYRQMIPTLANWLDQVVPQSTKDRLYVREGTFPEAYINAIAASPTAMNKVYFFRYLVEYLLTYLFALSAVYAMYLVCTELHLPAPATVFAPVIVILLVPYIQGTHGANYDFSELTVMALAVWFAIRFDWWWVAPIAILGVWNKESFVAFLPGLYPFFRMRSSRIGSITGVGVVGLSCLPTYLFIHHKFAGNLGSTAMFALPDQIKLLMHPLALLKLTEEVYGLPMLNGFTLLPAALVIWSIVVSWRSLPAAFKRHAQIMAAINIPLYLLFSFPSEVRDMSLLYISLLAILATNLKNWISHAELEAPSSGESAVAPTRLVSRKSLNVPAEQPRAALKIFHSGATGTHSGD